MSLHLSAFRDALDGILPSAIATTSASGEVNVSYLSDILYLDESHLALSFQFFNKTRQNILENPYAQVLVLHPGSSEKYRISVQYLRTETHGPLFERMRAKLAGIASHHGMAEVFQLRGADIYRVIAIEKVNSAAQPLPAQPSLMPALRRVQDTLSRCRSGDALISALFPTLAREMGIEHGMVLALDRGSGRLYTLASHGYATSGVGSEVALGDGVIGVCAEVSAPIRINHMLHENAYTRAIRRTAGDAYDLAPEIPLPGLIDPQSQLAVPIAIGGTLKGVLFVESPRNHAFTYEIEDALSIIGLSFGALLMQFHDGGCSEFDADLPEETPPCDCPVSGSALRVRYYSGTATVFLNDDYLIKGVAGAILWKLLREFAANGRTRFSSRELRLDPQLGLPHLSDNLATRLILLKRRLEERDNGIRLTQGGRGQLLLEVLHPLDLIEAGAA
ncbi:GAF domain-containing protein [Elstera cyanobacteriorum]|uniref:GAF domain-containing protein n=1 Tax=Elstera cyanobacteriorum TaxID=2022747 RepID=UPI002357F319|nr:GAF domain-containing protein [Elstera cyanobacteriorum]MCK6441549.1 GAF domain-containing protein [Elstera cyanobacteriorum]